MRKPQRPIQLVAARPETAGGRLALAVTVVIQGRGRVREVFEHGPKPRELAKALELAAAWIRAHEEDL